jgi:feruloyl esterase
LLRDRLLAACDEKDGLADQILHDPSACDFDAGTLTCEAGVEEDCLSADKVAAIQAVYAGPRNSTGSVFFGFPFGAEDVEANGWGSWLTGGAETGSPNAAYSFGVGILRNFVAHDPNWTYTQLDWDALPDQIRPVGHLLDANDPDLSEFRAQGGKLLMFHGWADVALSGHMSTDYVERVYAFDESARDDVRLFMMPGVLHCSGGAGPSVVDWLDVLENWHDTGQTPSELAATYPSKPGSRKVCAWPRQGIFQGGNPDSAADYLCR